MARNNIQLRRAQVIYTWGIGSTLDTADGDSLMLAGLDAWEKSIHYRASTLSDLKFNDIRLQKRLGIDYFLLPPEFIESRIRGRQPENTNLMLPFIRFPQWHLCTNCKNLKKTINLFWDEQGGMICGQCKSSKRMVPSRFVCICEEGHIQDFPYIEWAHLNNEICPDPSIKFIDNRGLDLKDIFIKCTNCSEGKSLAGMKKGISSHFTCQGHRPWLNDIDDGVCENELHATLRNASSVHNPIIKKSIYLANSLENFNERLYNIIDQQWMNIYVPESDGSVPQAILDHFATIISRNHNLDLNDVKSAINNRIEYERDISEQVNEEITEEEYRYKEYDVIINKQESPELKLEDCNLAEYETVRDYFDEIILIHRLRETIGFCGFTRINPPSGNANETQMAIRQLRINPFRIQDPDRWLPGIWARGEGIFVKFNTEKLNSWTQNQAVKKRVNKLLLRYNQYFDTFQNVNQNFILIHTFAHIIINQMAYECGYGSSSIKERIYFSSTSERSMNGLLIYTTGDSEGSLGGLVRLGKPGVFDNIIQSAVDKAKWCSLDPICIESKGQGPDGCNLAACHNCALVSETCCENGNRLLDRSLLIDQEYGFLKDL